MHKTMQKIFKNGSKRYLYLDHNIVIKVEKLKKYQIRLIDVDSALAFMIQKQTTTTTKKNR